MDTSLINEKQLLTEIDRLRAQFPHTQELYREVCVLLFFRYGMTPTANKLYQLVRRGSMTAPAEALNKFWEDLREKSRVRIEHPDLPEALKTSAGELIATLWSAAQAKAHETLDAYRSEAQASAVEAKAALSTAESERDDARRVMESVQHTLAESTVRIGTLEQQLAVANAAMASLETQLKEEKAGSAAHQQRLEDARRDFSSELDKLRAALQLAEERFRATETRSLLEIDRERSVAAKLQKELDASRIASAQAVDKARSETTELQGQLGDLRQKIGMLEGNLQAVAANRDAIAKELKASQDQAVDNAAQANLLRTDAENWRRQAEESQKILAALQEGTKPERTRRKSRAD